MSSEPGDSEEVGLERDLYRRLLELSRESEVTPLLERALELVATLAKARRGLLEIELPSAEARVHTYVHADSDDAGVDFRSTVSRGVIGHAKQRGKIIVTDSAASDDRFSAFESVENQKIEAVLCAPIGTPAAFGVIYLQGRTEPGSFSKADKLRVELCARQLGMLANRLLLRKEPPPDPTQPWRERFELSALVGRSRAMAVLMEEIALAAPLDISVLLTGPTGSGKSLVAEAIHQHSKRAAGPFVTINCATLPATLMESELFGAEKGAHSTATEAVEGKVAAAEGGTLFLDEVGELELPAQAKLL